MKFPPTCLLRAKNQHFKRSVAYHKLQESMQTVVAVSQQLEKAEAKVSDARVELQQSEGYLVYLVIKAVEQIVLCCPLDMDDLKETLGLLQLTEKMVGWSGRGQLYDMMYYQVTTCIQFITRTNNDESQYGELQARLKEIRAVSERSVDVDEEEQVVKSEEKDEENVQDEDDVQDDVQDETCPGPHLRTPMKKRKSVEDPDKECCDKRNKVS